MLRHSKFDAIIRYANHFTVLFLNSYFYVGNERKMVIKLKGYTYKITYIVAADIRGLPYLILTQSYDILLYSIVIMRNDPFFKIYQY